MSNDPEELPFEITEMSVLTDEVAEIYLQLHETEPIRSVGKSVFELDSEALSRVVGSNDLSSEIANTSSIYLFESAHELKALAALLRANQIAGSLEVLSRAIIERCGRVSWLLDHQPDVLGTQRAARAALEFGVSWQHYRETVRSIYSDGTEVSKEASRLFRQIRNDIEEGFASINKSGVVHSIDGAMPSPHISDWILDGTPYPDYTSLAAWTWFGSRENVSKAKATYKMLCAFSHPNIAASREHQVLENGRRTYRYQISYINKIVGNAVAGFDLALQSFCSYFDRNFDDVAARLISIHDRWPKGDDEE
jgi:hypothetical protein